MYSKCQNKSESLKIYFSELFEQNSWLLYTKHLIVLKVRPTSWVTRTPSQFIQGKSQTSWTKLSPKASLEKKQIHWVPSLLLGSLK